MGLPWLFYQIKLKCSIIRKRRMMKIPTFKQTLLLSIVFMVFSGCSEGPKPDTIDADEDLKCTRNGAAAPEWVCKNVEGSHMQTAVGQSDFSRIGENFMLSEATRDGQKAMQKEVYNYIDDRLSSFAREMGGLVAKTLDSETEAIAEAVSHEKMEDYKQIKLWRNPTDSSIEVLMAIQNKNINKDVRVKVLHLLKKDDAVYKEFLQNDGEDRLDEFLPLD